MKPLHPKRMPQAPASSLERYTIHLHGAFCIALFLTRSVNLRSSSIVRTKAYKNALYHNVCPPGLHLQKTSARMNVANIGEKHQYHNLFPHKNDNRYTILTFTNATAQLNLAYENRLSKRSIPKKYCFLRNQFQKS